MRKCKTGVQLCLYLSDVTGTFDIKVRHLEQSSLLVNTGVADLIPNWVILVTSGTSLGHFIISLFSTFWGF